jgi:hypothetical protein
VALLRISQVDFKSDTVHFEKQYEMNYEQFIEKYNGDNIIIDISDKIIISLRADSDYNLPMDLLTILIPEEDKYKYKATLIYSGHIAFIKLEYKDGKIVYFYKDDECHPGTWDEWMSWDGDVKFCCEEKGFTVRDMEIQVEKIIQSTFDYNYKFDKDKIIVLEGL